MIDFRLIFQLSYSVMPHFFNSKFPQYADHRFVPEQIGCDVNKISADPMKI